MADQTRYTIFKELLIHDYCVGGLARKLELTEAAVSQHLKILRNSGLITGERHGYFMHHQVNQNLLKQVAHTLIEMSETLQRNSSSCSVAEKENCTLCSSGT